MPNATFLCMPNATFLCMFNGTDSNSFEFSENIFKIQLMIDGAAKREDPVKSKVGVYPAPSPLKINRKRFQRKSEFLLNIFNTRYRYSTPAIDIQDPSSTSKSLVFQNN